MLELVLAAWCLLLQFLYTTAATVAADAAAAAAGTG